MKTFNATAKLYLTDDEDTVSNVIFNTHDKMDFSVGSLHVFKYTDANGNTFNTSGQLVALGAKI